MILLAMFVLTISLKSQCVLAKEYENEVNITTSDMEISLPGNNYTMTERDLTVEEITAKIAGDEIVLDAAVGIQAASIEDETDQPSTLRCGSLSGYLSETGDYALYSLNLSAGEYLQARLLQPNNTEIDYDLVIYDSSLTVIKVSDYNTYMYGEPELEESVGYLATTDELIYIGVFSIIGGSETEAYTLDFSITTNFSDNGEPNENAREAVTLTLGTTGTTVTGKLNTAIDNDWYSFTVPDSPACEKVRLILESNSTVNGCNMEIYRNLATDYFVMERIGQGTQGEVELPAGTYFLRVISTSTFENFDAGDIPAYKLMVTPVGKVDEVAITMYSGYHGAEGVRYDKGTYYRIDDNPPNKITIFGWAYYKDSMGNKYTSPNVAVTACVKNNQLEAIGRSDLAVTYGTAVTDSNGHFVMTVYMNPALGGLTYAAPISMHYYDFMDVDLRLTYNDAISTKSHFYILKMSVLY